MQKHFIIASAIALLASTAAFAEPTGTSASNANNDLASERADRNSVTGDRAQGGFGPAQSDYVNSLPDGQNYGQDVLGAGGWTGADTAPGQQDDPSFNE